MKFDCIRFYEERKTENLLGDKIKIVFIKNYDRCERVEQKDGSSVFFSKSDNTKKYYPQNYKEFLKMLKATKVVNGGINIYDVYLGAPLSHDYTNKNFTYYQDKMDLNKLIQFAKEYYCDKTLPQTKQIEQKNEFFKRCCMILGEKIGVVTAEVNR